MAAGLRLEVEDARADLSSTASAREVGRCIEAEVEAMASPKANIAFISGIDGALVKLNKECFSSIHAHSELRAAVAASGNAMVHGLPNRLEWATLV